MKRAPEAGFSLVEILVVLAILAVMAGTAMISLGAINRGGQPESEAKLFASRLSLAVDEALVTDRQLSLVVDERGYAVQVSADGGREWLPHPDPLLGARHDLARGIRIETETIPGRIALRPDAATQAFSIVFRNGDGGWRVTEDGFGAHASAIFQ